MFADSGSWTSVCSQKDSRAYMVKPAKPNVSGSIFIDALLLLLPGIIIIRPIIIIIFIFIF